MKKIYILIGILLIATFGMAYLYFSNLNTERNANELSLNAVANNSGIVFCFENDKSFYDILSGQDLLQNVLGETKSAQLKSLKQNLVDYPRIFNAFEGQKIYIGVLPGTENNINYLIGTQLKPNSKPQKLLENFDSGATLVKGENNIYQLNLKDSTTVFVGIKNQLVLISNALASIDKALKEHIPSTSFGNYIKNNNRFNKNTLANLYINFNQMPALLKNILNSKLSGELSVFNKQDSFAALSYNFSKEKLLFNGTTVLNNPNSYDALFLGMPAQKLTITRIIPVKTANYTVYAITDYRDWQKELMNWMATKKEDQRVKKHLSNLNERYRLDLQQIFPKYFKDQLLTFQLSTGEKFGAISLTNGEKVGQLLLDLSGEYATDIRIFKEPYLPYAFFGEPFKKFERPFYTIIDNYMIMANNASSIEVFLNSYKNNSLLINDDAYISFSNQLSSSATICYYVNHKNSIDIFGRNLKMPYYKQYLAENGFRSYGSFCYQLSADNGKFQSNLLLDKKIDKTQILDTVETIP